MRIRLLAFLAAGAVAALACGGESDDEEGSVDTTAPPTAEDSAPGRSADDTDGSDSPEGATFTWITTMDLDGSGYELVVAGTVGPDHADYTMQVSPFAADDETSDMVASIAGASVNGLDLPGAERTVDNVDAEGFTEVIVIGDDRWYRSPWLLDEAAYAMEGNEWVHVSAGVELPFIADIAGRVLTARHDDAVRALRDMVAAGDRIEAPPAPPDRTELDELLIPWIGLVGPDARNGAPAVVDGDAAEATVTWEQTLTYEPDGADGRLAGEVSWRRSPAARPAPPDPDAVIEVEDLAARLSEAG